jgi:hypothetical protein
LLETQKICESYFEKVVLVHRIGDSSLEKTIWGKPGIHQSFTTGKAGGLKAPEPLKAVEKQEPPKGDC